MRIAFLLLIACACWAVESGPVTVLRVVDGDTIVVEGKVGEAVLPVSVRLLYVDTPELNAKDEAQRTLAKEAKAELEAFSQNNGDQVVLTAPGEAFQTDRYGRLLAVVGSTQEGGYSAQTILITKGLSPYWTKYGETTGKMHKVWTTLEDSAKRAKLGAWATAPKWIQDKANETTARQ